MGKGKREAGRRWRRRDGNKRRDDEEEERRRRKGGRKKEDRGIKETLGCAPWAATVS